MWSFWIHIVASLLAMCLPREAQFSISYIWFTDLRQHGSSVGDHPNCFRAFGVSIREVYQLRGLWVQYVAIRKLTFPLNYELNVLFHPIRKVTCGQYNSWSVKTINGIFIAQYRFRKTVSTVRVFKNCVLPKVSLCLVRFPTNAIKLLIVVMETHSVLCKVRTGRLSIFGNCTHMPQRMKSLE